MARQIQETRVTEDQAFANIDKNRLLELHYETSNLKDRIALEVQVIDERSNREAGELLDMTAEGARQHAIMGKRALIAKLAADDFDPTL